jgi:hypothetical protein
MNKTLTSAAAALALIAFPAAAADAKPGKGNGHGHAHGHVNAPWYSGPSGSDSYSAAPFTTDDSETPPPAPETETSEKPSETREERRAARKCKKGRKVGFSVRGTLAGYTAEDVTLTVVRANKHARSFIEGDAHTFAIDGARVKFEGVTDTDESGEVDFADVAPTDVVKVTGKVVRPKKGCDAGEPAVTIRKVHVERPEADEAEEPEVTEES